MFEPSSTAMNHGFSGAVQCRHAALKARLLPGLVQVAAWPETLGAVEGKIAEVMGASLPVGPCKSIVSNDYIVMAIAPGTFLIESSVAGTLENLTAVITQDMGSVTDLTHARVCFSIEGTNSQWILSKGLAIDLDLAEFPVDRVVQSAINEIGLVVRRVAENQFDLYVYRSFAADLWNWLIAAGNGD